MFSILKVLSEYNSYELYTKVTNLTTAPYEKHYHGATILYVSHDNCKISIWQHHSKL